MDRVNLFVIGVKKAGTSWLWQLLDCHPQVYMCTEKELYYFGNDYPADLDIYHAHFPFDRDYRYFGEATPDYVCSSGVVDELREYNPNAKLLAVLRDPIDRLRSEFMYQKQLGNLPESLGFSALLSATTAHLRARSHYERMLPRFERAFGSDRLLILSMEQATANPSVAWSAIQDFLDLRRIAVPRISHADANPTGSRAFRSMYRSLIRPVKNRLPWVYRAMLRSPLFSDLKKLALVAMGSEPRRPLPPAVQEKLRTEYEPTYEYLHQLGFDRYH